MSCNDEKVMPYVEKHELMNKWQPADSTVMANIAELQGKREQLKDVNNILPRNFYNVERKMARMRSKATRLNNNDLMEV